MPAAPNPLQAAVLAGLQKYPRLDPQAVLAVARQEGLSGGIGDGGHAFGPWQLNNAGGVITGKFQGQSPQQIQAWASSPAGIDYALQGINKVAGGQRGAQAINSIVRQFERPADPNGEVARALGQSGGGAASATYSPPVAGAAAPPGNRQAMIQALLGSIGPTGQLSNPSALVSALRLRQSPAPGYPSTPGTSSAAGGSHGLSGGILELLNEGTGGPTHSTGPHVHAAFGNPQLEIAAINKAQSMGLHVGENPYVGDTVDPVHAPNSYHTRNFFGTYNGRKLGQAIDVSGGDTSGFYKWLQQRQGG